MVELKPPGSLLFVFMLASSLTVLRLSLPTSCPDSKVVRLVR